jgi:DNA-binding CsgD family transcriptional regulator
MGSGSVRFSASSLSGLRRQLHDCHTAEELLTTAANQARDWCGVDRAVILRLDRRQLVATGVGALSQPASDLLRRRVLAMPISLRGGCAENEMLRRAYGEERLRVTARSAAAEALDLTHFSLALVTPESVPAALLVVDRADGPLLASAHDAVEIFSHLAGLALHQVLLKARLQAVAKEVQYVTATARAFTREALEAPLNDVVELQAPGALSGMTGAHTFDRNTPGNLLSQRQLQVMELLAEGYSNREIAAALCLSVETVKSHVANIRLRLGAANRTEAVTRFVQSVRPSDDVHQAG